MGLRQSSFTKVTKLPSNVTNIKWVSSDGQYIYILSNSNNSQNIYYSVAYTGTFVEDSYLTNTKVISSSSATWTQENGILDSVSISNGSLSGINFNNDMFYKYSINNDWNGLSNFKFKNSSISIDKIGTSIIISGIINTLAYYDNSLNSNYKIVTSGGTQNNNILAFIKLSNGVLSTEQYSAPNTKNASTHNNNLYVINNSDNNLYYLLNYSSANSTNNIFNTSFKIVNRPKDSNNNTVTLNYVDFTDYLLCVIDTNNNIYGTFDVYNQTPIWFKIPGELKQISVSDYGIFGVNSSNELYGMEYYTPYPLISYSISLDGYLEISVNYNFLNFVPYQIKIKASNSINTNENTYNLTLFQGMFGNVYVSGKSIKVSDYKASGTSDVIIYTSVNFKNTVDNTITNFFNYSSKTFTFNLPTKIVVNNASSANNSINLNFKIPSIKNAIVNSYTVTGYSPNNCKFKKTFNRSDTSDPNNIIFNRDEYSDATINIANLKNRNPVTYSITGNIPDCTSEPYDYVKMPHKYLIGDTYNMNKKQKIEPYIFTIKAVNSAGENEISDPTSDIVPIVSTPSATGPSTPSATGPSTPSIENNDKLYLFIGIFLIVIISGIGFWYFSYKNENNIEVNNK